MQQLAHEAAAENEAAFAEAKADLDAEITSTTEDAVAEMRRRVNKSRQEALRAVRQAAFTTSFVVISFDRRFLLPCYESARKLWIV